MSCSRADLSLIHHLLVNLGLGHGESCITRQCLDELKEVLDAAMFLVLFQILILAEMARGAFGTLV